MKRIVKLCAALLIVGILLAGCEAKKPDVSQTNSEKPIEISLYYSDNATLPFKADWLTVQESEKRSNTKLHFEPIPIADYNTKVSLALNTGNGPDVILYQNTNGENGSLALNGALIPISDYPEWTPNFNAQVKKFGLEKDIDALRLCIHGILYQFFDNRRRSLNYLTGCNLVGHRVG